MRVRAYVYLPHVIVFSCMGGSIVGTCIVAAELYR